MDEGLKHLDFMFVSNNHSPEISDPGDRAFDFPASTVSSELPSILQRIDPSTLVWTDQVNTTSLQPSPQRIGVGGFIVDQSLRVFAWTTSTASWYGNAIQSRFDQCHFVRRGRGKLHSQRNTLAVCHHHKLRTLSATGWSNVGTPFFAEANVPSANTSCHWSWPFASSSFRNTLQMRSHTPCSSQSRKRRQQVLGDGYRLGKSFQRAPLRNTQRMPSKHSRFDIHLGPPFDDVLVSGSNGPIRAHIASVNSDSSRDIKNPPSDDPLKPKH